MITSLEIKNFRCFEKFSIEKLTPITIIGGKNNSGKSALLEAFVAPLSVTFPSVFWDLLNFRNIGSTILTPTQLWNPLFYNMTDTEEFSIKIFQDNGKPVVFTATKIYNGIVERNTKKIFSQDSGKKFSSLKVKISNELYNSAGTYNLPNQISNNANELEFKSDSNPNKVPLPYGAVTLCRNVTTTRTSVAESVSQMSLDKDKKNLLVTTMQKFDPLITDVNMILDSGVPYIYVTLDNGTHLPISYMGDGINKSVEILVDILNLPNGVLLIDEVENGFHFSLYETLMKIFCETALKVHCQIILTSHNRDFIRATLNAMEQLGQLDKLSYQRLGFYKGKRQAFLFSGESLYSAFESDMEMR